MAFEGDSELITETYENWRRKAFGEILVALFCFAGSGLLGWIAFEVPIAGLLAFVGFCCGIGKLGFAAEVIRKRGVRCIVAND